MEVDIDGVEPAALSLGEIDSGDSYLESNDLDGNYLDGNYIEDNDSAKVNPSKAGPIKQEPPQTKNPVLPEISEGQIRYTAMSLLARREHSRFELKQKLSQRYLNHFSGNSLSNRYLSNHGLPDELDSSSQADRSVLIESVLQQLADEALQSDSRFAEAFVSMRVRKGQGPIRIEKELEQRRIEAKLINDSLALFDGDWIALAKKAHSKKYPRCQPLTVSAKEKARQIRFLQYRGFSGEHIQGIWKESQGL